MFRLDEQKTVALTEFLNDYNQASWLGYISKDADRVHHGQWTVKRVVNADFSAKSDIYLSYNPLAGYKPRKKSNIGKLALLYVDLDIGRDDNPFLDANDVNCKQDAIDGMIKTVFGITAPNPNYIVDSGRGLYLIYKIYQNEAQTKHEHANAAKRWERVNSYLTEAFSWYAADPAVSTDEARVLRIPGSINSHSGTQVKFYKYSDDVHTLYNIERDYMSTPTDAQIAKLEQMEALIGIKCSVRNRRSVRRFMATHEDEYRRLYNKKAPSEKQLKYASDIARTLQIDCPKFRTAGGVSTFIKRHENDFLSEKAKRKNHSTYIDNDDEKTLKMLKLRLSRIERALMDAPRDSYRERGLFFYRLFACEYTGDKKLAADMTLELIRNMQNPLPEASAMRTTRSAEKYWDNHRVYKMTDEALAGWFDMSLDEWKALIPHEAYKVDKELRSERNKRYYQSQLKKAGKTSKQEQIELRRNELIRLIRDGKNKDEICSELGVSERTYFADYKAVQEVLSCAEAQDTVVEGTAKNSDSISNSGPIGPNRAKDVRDIAITRDSVVDNPFVDLGWSVKLEEVEEGWTALMDENPVGVVRYHLIS